MKTQLKPNTEVINASGLNILSQYFLIFLVKLIKSEGLKGC